MPTTSPPPESTESSQLPSGGGRPRSAHQERLAALSLAALGVVFGDIGTSPLYALRECFFGAAGVQLTQDNVLGVLSLIFWTLIITISIKYQALVLRADNRGEGGILALVALLDPWHAPPGKKSRALAVLGVLGAALLYGDAIITPAISVLSAVEGLQVAAPALSNYVVPITVMILIMVFWLQKRGTGRVGALFGPVMVVWFVVLGLLGIRGILYHPEVLASVNPVYAIDFLAHQGATGFLVLGAVFLVATGGEALYADLGHFGRRPIRLVWFTLVLPGLLLNYMGQGALLLGGEGDVSEPFFHLAPDWALYPMIVLSTLATIVASQAIISGVFSLTNQAVQLGQAPRMRIVQTSAEEMGQIYVPLLNWVLMFSTIALVLHFKSSSNLTGAYGVAVSTTMLITTVLTHFMMRDKWKWPLPLVIVITSVFLFVDFAFFTANLIKIEHGGWFPILTGAVVFTLMSTWSSGRQMVIQHLVSATMPLDEFLGRMTDGSPVRVPGTAVFMTAPDLGAPPILQYHLVHNQVLHEQVVLVTVITKDMPWVAATHRLRVFKLKRGFWRVHIHYGFMQTPNVPLALRLCEKYGLRIDPNSTTYYLGRETLLPPGQVSQMGRWRQRLFAFMSRNAVRATDFFKLPPHRTVELGIRLELLPIAHRPAKSGKTKLTDSESRPEPESTSELVDVPRIE